MDAVARRPARAAGSASCPMTTATAHLEGAPRAWAVASPTSHQTHPWQDPAHRRHGLHRIARRARAARPRRRGPASPSAPARRPTTSTGLDCESVRGRHRTTAAPCGGRCAASTASSTCAGPHVAAAAATQSCSGSTSRARAPCSRSACGPGSSASSTRRRWPRSDRRRPGDDGRRDAASSTRAATSIPYVNSKHEAEIEALRLRGARAAGRDRQPGPRLRPRRPRTARRPSSCAASCCAGSRRTWTAALNIVDVERRRATGTCSPTRRARSGERYILGNRNYTLDRLFADLGRAVGRRAAGAEAAGAVALAHGAGRRARCRAPADHDRSRCRGSSLWWTYRNTKAKRELGWSPRRTRTRSRRRSTGTSSVSPTAGSRAGSAQPLPLKIAGSVVKRAGSLTGRMVL